MTCFRIRTLCIALGLSSTLLFACQPAAGDDDDAGADPEAVLEAFETAVLAMSDAATAHADTIAAAADEAAVLAEEAAFAGSGHDLFTEAVHAAEELAGCTGMEVHEEDNSPEDLHGMLEALDEAFEGHEAAMTAAAEADRADVEQAFQDEVTLHSGHADGLHDEMHEHAEAGELTCAEAHEE